MGHKKGELAQRATEHAQIPPISAPLGASLRGMGVRQQVQALHRDIGPKALARGLGMPDRRDVDPIVSGTKPMTEEQQTSLGRLVAAYDSISAGASPLSAQAFLSSANRTGNSGLLTKVAKANPDQLREILASHDLRQ